MIFKSVLRAQFVFPPPKTALDTHSFGGFGDLQENGVGGTPDGEVFGGDE